MTSDQVKDHYVYLTSLANSTEHPENTIARFTNRMNPPLQLNGSWSVGLINCFFNNDFVSIRGGDASFRLELSIQYLNEDDLAIGGENVVYIPTRDIKGRNVQNVLKSLETDLRSFLIHQKFIKEESDVLFSFAPTHRNLVFHPLLLENPSRHKHKSVIGSWTCAKNIAALLGVLPYAPRRFHNLSSYAAKKFPVLNNGVDNVYIYTDIVKGSHVGGGQSDILDVLAMGSTYSKNSTTVIYKNVKHDFIESISIVMTDQNGRGLKFLDGNSTTCILHFRKE
jgi:hypothetical protein